MLIETLLYYVNNWFKHFICIILLYNIHNILDITSCKKDENGSVAYTVLLLVDGSRDVQIYFSDYISLIEKMN